MSTRRPPTALSIAGSDPSGGAGIQADLKTFQARGVYGMAVITALTAQNTRAVAGVSAVDGRFIALQMQTLLDDIVPDAVKVGMLGTADIARSVARSLAAFDGPVVVDPVMVSTSGAALLAPDAEAVVKAEVVPCATLLTPNIPEAQRLLGSTSPEAYADHTGVALLLKDGHNTEAVVRDRLVLPGGPIVEFEHPRVASRNTHGTGCTLSSAIAAELATGLELRDAVGSALDWLATVIAESAPHDLGSGHGPLLHGAGVRARICGPTG
jgi:hydroxymethylpyrimidine/phosphomethylpyrimidine kinase